MNFHSDAINYETATPAGASRAGSDAAAGAQSADGPGFHYFTIGQMARHYQVSLRALRFYEDRALLKPQRHGAVRLYDTHQRERLQLILKGKQLGFKLSEIRALLAKQDSGRPAEFEQTLDAERVLHQIAALERQRKGLDRAIELLRATQARHAAAAV